MVQTAALILSQPSEDEERDRSFEPYRRAATEDTKAVIAEAIKLLTSYEQRFGLRKNKRRSVDQQTFEETVDAVLSDLIHHHLLGHPGRTYISRSNKLLGTKSRYRSRVHSKVLPYFLDIMATPEMAYINQEIGVQRQVGSKLTTIVAGPRLLSEIVEREIDIGDVDKCPPDETIILKRLKDRTDHWDKGSLQEYDDTDETNRYRAEMEIINQWIAQSRLDFNRLGFFETSRDIDTGKRQLRRIFTKGSFRTGGRLFGGFWQDLSKQARHERLTINGEQAVELDYGQVGPRILYGMAGIEPPETDIYDIRLFDQQRPGIKKVMNAMMFAESRLKRFPRGTRKLFRHGDNIVEVAEAIEAANTPIKHLLHCGMGHEVQFTESQILVDVLLKLKDREIVALPIHDAVMVPKSKASTAHEVMLSAFEAIAGTLGIVTLEE